jgi:hypothetical protein
MQENYIYKRECFILGKVNNNNPDLWYIFNEKQVKKSRFLMTTYLASGIMK